MTRYADPERCPDCLSAMTYGASRCPSCGLVLEGPLAAELFTTLRNADTLLARMRTASNPAAADPTSEEPATAQPSTAGLPISVSSAGADALDAEGDGAVATLLRPPRTTTTGAGGPPPYRPAVGGHGGLSGTSVPKILLALGALCLLIAALVFLAVAWSAMGVAGRTATLLGFTAVAGGLTAWAARRDLRAAAESLGVVALGLLSFDLFGARDAGWLGEISTPAFFVVLGLVLAAVGAAAATAVRRTPVASLVGAELIATLGIVSASAGAVTADWFTWSTALTLTVVLTAAAAAAAFLGRLEVMGVGASLVSISAWVVLAISSWERAVTHASFEELWLELEVWPLLATAFLVGAPALVRSLPDAVRLTAAGTAVVALAAALMAPFTDETMTEWTVSGAALLAAVAVLALVLPQPWRRTMAGVGSLGLLWMTLAALQLAGTAFARIIETGGDLWTRGAGDTFASRSISEWELASWLLPVVAVAAAAALVAAARSFSWADRRVAPLLELDIVLAAAAAGAAFTLALHAVPIWLVLGVLLATGVVFVARYLRRQHGLRLLLATGFLALALQLSLHAEWLTLPTLLVLLGGSLAVHLRSRSLDVSVVAGALVAGATAGVVWTIGAVANAPVEWTAVATLLVLAALTLGGPYVDERLRVSGPATYARLGTELGALVSATVVSLAGVDLATSTMSETTWVAGYLTIMGATVVAMALLRPDRRSAGWLGGFLLAAASWVRLADLGVETPEAYTLPSALALLVVGLVRLRRDPAASSLATLTPGLLLALVPSLLWAVADPIALRSVLLGLATLGLVVAGVLLRWSAPLVHGALVGAVLVVRLATPYADAVPRWALIGAAGVLLVTMGITWEKRARDARAVAGYVRSLR